MLDMLESNRCTPAQASKLRGVLGFLVGRACLRPLLQREYSDVLPWSLGGELRRCLMFFRRLIADLIPRTVHLGPGQLPPVFVASDARLDDDELPTLAVLMFDAATSTKKCLVAVVPEELLSDLGCRH